MQKIERNRESKTRDQHVWNELKLKSGAFANVSIKTYTVTSSCSVQWLPKGAPCNRGAVITLHLLSGPDVRTLYVLQDFPVTRQHGFHNGEVEQSADDRADRLDGECRAWREL